MSVKNRFDPIAKEKKTAHEKLQNKKSKRSNLTLKTMPDGK